MARHEEPYLLAHRKSDIAEDHRLDTQHETVKNTFCGGKCLHPRVPISEIQTAVADIGTGTGIWLNEVVTFGGLPSSSQMDFVGFDISGEKFMKQPAPGVRFEIHDATKPFPKQYHGKFDLVHVRLLVYAIPQRDFRALVENVIQILRKPAI